jgi:hypothetical protein
VGTRLSAPVQTGLGAHPASYTVEYRVCFPRRGVDHPHLPSAGIKERVELYLCSPSGPSCLVLGRTLPLYLYKSSLLVSWKPQSFNSSFVIYCKSPLEFSFIRKLDITDKLKKNASKSSKSFCFEQFLCNPRCIEDTERGSVPIAVHRLHYAFCKRPGEQFRAAR